MSGQRTRHEVATSDELEDGSKLIADVRGREVAVFFEGGEYYAVANHCIHQAGPLCEGELQATQDFFSGEDAGWEWRQQDEKRVIVCPWHAWRFDITTGENVDDDRYAVPTYDVEVDDEQIYVIA